MNKLVARQPAGALAANLDQLIEGFLLEQDVSPASKVVYRRALKPFKEFLQLREASGATGYLTRTDVVQYKSHLLAQGMSPRTGNLYLTALRQFFRYLEVNRIYPDVAAGLKGFKRSSGFNRDPLTVQQARELPGCNRLLKPRRHARLRDDQPHAADRTPHNGGGRVGRGRHPPERQRYPPVCPQQGQGRQG